MISMEPEPQLSSSVDTTLLIRQRKHPLRVALAVVVVAYTASILYSLATNHRLEWSVVGEYLFNASVLSGVVTTIELTAISMIAAVILGALFAEMDMSRSLILRGFSRVYVWLFRSMPTLVLLLLSYNIGAIYPKLSLGLPFMHGGLVLNASGLAPLAVAAAAFALHESPFIAEIYRSAIQSIPAGQSEAAKSLGMTHFQTRVRIIFPAAFRIVLPIFINQLTNLLKGTAIVSFIGLSDILYSVKEIYSVNYEVVPLLAVATIWYMVMVSFLSLVQYGLEYRLKTSS